jgi:hypothetical protein
MKKLFVLFMAFVLVASFTSAASGSIWTTNGDCGDSSQDVNHYAIGDVVYINGANFDELTSYDWDITGLPGQASCDSGLVVADGNYVTDSNGGFCFEAYTVANDDCGEYKAHFDNKQDNYRVDDPSVPEFGVIAGAVAMIGALTIFIVRRRH